MIRRLGIALALMTLAPAGNAVAAANVGGVWKLIAVNPPEDVPAREGLLTLKQEGETITGTIAVRDRVIAIREAVLQENDLRFKVSAEQDGVTITVAVKATIDGDSLKGTAEGAAPAPIAFTGTRHPAAAITGAWNLTVETPNQTYRPTVTLTQEGEKLTGSLRTEDGVEAKLVSGSVKGDAVSFVVDLTIGDQDLHLEFGGVRSGNGLKGDLRVGDQSYPWKGERAQTASAPAK
jgi:hypothetical protein